MDPALRVITRLPLSELWNEKGAVEATKLRPLGQAEVRELLRSGDRVRIVVADLGSRPRWIAGDDRSGFWKDELRPHLVEPRRAEEGFYLEDLPDERGYVANEWRTADGSVLIVAESFH